MVTLMDLWKIGSGGIIVAARTIRSAASVVVRRSSLQC